MAQPIRALILDDQVWSQKLLKGLLTEIFPNVEIECRSEPDPTGKFDLYFLDNDFHGELLAGKLAHDVRQVAPDSLIIAFSGTLTAHDLKELIKAGCDGVCDKSVPEDLPTTMEIVQTYLEALEKERMKAQPGIIGAVKSISEMIGRWNHRLERQEEDLKGPLPSEDRQKAK